MSAHIYIGLGGSGLKTLQELTKLISQDEGLSRDFRNRIFFLLIDTELDEIEKTRATVADYLHISAGDGHVHECAIAKGYTTLQSVVPKYFPPLERGAEPNRAQQHWWYNAEGQPFTAVDVNPVTKGAGQCAPVSFFLTWIHLRELRTTVEAILEEIIRKYSADDDNERHRKPLEEVRYKIIAGTAGGTGRGSWETVSFIVREVFAKRAAPIKAGAILFDAHVTRNEVRRLGGGQWFSTRVNSLTAYSQLSMWSRFRMDANNRTNESIQYTLPSLEKPDDPAADLIPEERAYKEFCSPVDFAYIITNENQNRTAHLDSSRDFYSMLARGLFAEMKFPNIESEFINENYFFYSMGAATFEVPAADLQYFFEVASKRSFLMNLGAVDEGAVDRALEAFRSATGLGIDFRQQSNFFPIGDERDYNLWQRCGAKLYKRTEGLVSEFQSSLSEDRKDSQELLTNMLEPQDEAAAQSVRDAFSEIGGDFQSIFQNLYREHLYQGTLGSDRVGAARSVANVQRFLQKLRAELVEGQSSILAALPQNLDTIEGESTKDLYVRSSGRKYVVAGERFEPNEITKIIESIPENLVRANYPALREEFSRQLETFLEQSVVFLENCAYLLKRAEVLRKKTEDKLKEHFDNATDFASVVRQVFCNPDNPEGEIGAHDSHERFYRRRLVPPATLAEVENAVATCYTVRTDSDAKLDAFIENTIFGASAAGVDDQRFTKELEGHWNRCVIVEKDFVRKNYDFAKVLDKTIKCWRRRLANLRGSAKDLHEARESFHAFFGYMPVEEQDEVVIPAVEDLIPYMIASLCASTAPWWRLRDGTVTEGSLQVTAYVPQLPVKWTSTRRAEWERFVAGRLKNVRVRLLPEADDDRLLASNPYMLISYARSRTERIEDIATLDYWKEDSEVVEILGLCEKSDFLVVQGRDSKTGRVRAAGINGIGYHDPVFVREKSFSELRWKPWLESNLRRSAKEEKQSAVLTAMLYMLLDSSWLDGLAAACAESEWSLPLAVENESGVWKFARGKLEIAGSGKAVAAIESTFVEGAQIGHKPGIAALHEWLHADASEAALGELLAEREIFWSSIANRSGLGRGTKHYEGLLAKFHDHLRALLSRKERHDYHDRERREQNDAVIKALVAALDARKSEPLL